MAERVIRLSNSNYSSALHIVPKKDKTLRLVSDYRQLNKVTKRDTYTIPNLHDFCAELDGSKFFSLLDLKSAYFNVGIHSDDMHKTCIKTPVMTFEYLVLPFGLSNSAATFVKYLYGVLRGIKNIFVYMDDIIIFSADVQTHAKILKQVSTRLDRYECQLSIDKCLLGQKQIVFLGHLVNEHGIRPNPEKVKAIVEYPLPQTQRGIRRFLGMLQFYSKFVPNIALEVKCMYELINCKRGKNAPIKWNKEAMEGFTKSKKMLSDHVLLQFPIHHAETKLVVDASKFGCGAYIAQKVK